MKYSTEIGPIYVKLMKDSRTQNIAESPKNEKMFTCLGPAASMTCAKS
jgi:hypothetical protein